MASEESIESSQRALERAEAVAHAKLKRGLGVLAAIGATAPFVGLFGTVVGILGAFKQIATQSASRIGAVGRVLEFRLRETALPQLSRNAVQALVAAFPQRYPGIPLP